MQLMPATAADLGVNDSFKPGENVRGRLDLSGCAADPLPRQSGAGAGRLQRRPAAVDRYHGIPPYHETRAYVARVIHEFNRRVLARADSVDNNLAAGPGQPRAPCSSPVVHSGIAVFIPRP